MDTRDLSTPELLRALGRDLDCAPDCTCRGSYTGPDRRATHRVPTDGGVIQEQEVPMLRLFIMTLVAVLLIAAVILAVGVGNQVGHGLAPWNVR